MLVNNCSHNDSQIIVTFKGLIKPLKMVDFLHEIHALIFCRFVACF